MSDAADTPPGGDNSPAPAAGPPRVSDRYAIEAGINTGGAGIVYRATDVRLDRPVAIKVSKSSPRHDPGAASRFAEEGRITARLQHHGIPPIHDRETFPDGRPCLVMKLVDGDTLDELLARRADPATDRGRFLAVFEQVCQAVGYAHNQGVVHRDLTPKNIMVGAFGEVQVVDWGMARELPPGGPGAGGKPARGGEFFGTPAYMPPEQAAGAAHKATPRSDVFGLGAVLAVILTGRPPFEAASEETTRVMAAQGDLGECLARLDACGAEPELVALCKRCLRPKPADRPADAGEVAAAVTAFRQAAEARARQAELDKVKAEGEKATAEATAAEQRKRRRVQFWLAAAVVLLVAGAGGVAVWRVDENGKQREREATAEAEAERREQAEQVRRARDAGATAELLDQAEKALTAGDAARAALPLAEARRRAADGGVTDHAGRLERYQDDLTILRELDKVDDYRWNAERPPVVELRLPTARPEADRDRWKLGGQSPHPPAPRAVPEMLARAFAAYGVVPGTTPPAEAADRVRTSPLRAALVGALDDWLVLAAEAGAAETGAIRDVAVAADPDPFRDEVRTALAARAREPLEKLVGRPEWDGQPGALLRAYAAIAPVEAEEVRERLARRAATQPNDFRLLMQLGGTYPIGTPDGAGERVRWYQAAAALRPGSWVVFNRLGLALADNGDSPGAAAAYREASRLAPKTALPQYNLGNLLWGDKDLAGAEAAYREAVGRDPTFPLAQTTLGNLLRSKGDWGGAAKAFRALTELEPKNVGAHYSLAVVLRELGDPTGAAAALREVVRLTPADVSARVNFSVVLREAADPGGAAAAAREAVRLNPRYAPAHYNLGLALRNAADLDGAVAAFRDAALLDRKYEDLLPRLGDECRRLGRHADAARAFRAALDVQPNRPDVCDGLDYCERVLRGEVPTGPPPRAVAR